MPIKIPNDLPAVQTLLDENIFAMTETRAITQDIRPLKILLLNLMPKKIETETQISRILGNTPLQIELTLIRTKSHQSQNTAQEHLLAFYKTFDDVKDEKYDGMIITGAPVEMMEFEEVDYWGELCEIMEWTKHNVYSTMYICWGAFAGLHYKYGIDKKALKKKLSGVYLHRTIHPSHPLVRGFDEVFYAPHSRYSGVDARDIEKCSQLILLADSEEAGAYLAASKDGRSIFVFGHSEYDADTLKTEYLRDLDKGINPDIPVNYFTNDNISTTPVNKWRSHAHLLFANWLNYFVYQGTPYNLEEIL